MAKFDFIIDDDGKAKPVIPVTVFLTTEEEKAAMIEAAKRRTLRLIEWHPIRDGEDMPRDGETVLVAVRTGRNFLQTVWTTIDIYGRDGDEMRFASFEPGEVIAWAPMPEPYDTKD